MSNAWKRPKLNIPKTKSEWVWDIFGYGIYFASAIFLIASWSRLPEKVPAHYNAFGVVDRWGSKWELILLPIITTFLLIFLQLLEKHPEVHNYPARLNESNAAEFYLLSRKLLNQMKNICLILLSALLVESISIALGWGSILGKWFLSVLFISMFFPIVVMIVKQRKIK